MGYFTTDGRRLETIDEMIAMGEVFMFEGGQFIWPGVKVGFKQKVYDLDTGAAVLETLAMDPLVFGVENFLTVNECDHIIAAAEPSMHDSGVSHMDKDKGRPSTDWRTRFATAACTCLVAAVLLSSSFLFSPPFSPPLSLHTTP
jgi:prolyl 4-hydroxylase